MILVEKGLVVLWFGLATLLVIPANTLERTRRIINEPGDVPKLGKNSLPFLKRQQIIYLLNSNNDKRGIQEPKKMEAYANELTPDGKVVRPHTTKFSSSEDFHGGGVREIAVNKGDGPPVIYRETNAAVEPLVNKKEPASPSNSKIAVTPVSVTNKDFTKSTNLYKKLNDTLKKRTQTPILQHIDVNASKKSEYPKTEDSNTPIVKNRNIIPYKLFRNADGELIMPAPREIDPNIFEIGEGQIRETPRRFAHMRYRDGRESELSRRWGSSGRWRPRPHYYRRRQRPVFLGHRPDVFITPVYSRTTNPPILSYQSGPVGPVDGSSINSEIMQPTAAFGNQMTLQPVSLPVVTAPQQPTLQSPLIQQADARSVLYNVPMGTTAAQLPQPVVYPIFALPSFPQTQQFVQVQPGVHLQPELRPLAHHWSDEQGHARSEEPPRPPPDYDEDRPYDDDDDRYMYNNERPFYRGRDYDDPGMDEPEDYPRRRPFYEESADVRSDRPDLPPPSLTDDNNEDDEDDENEVESYQQDLQDSKDDPLPADISTEIQREAPLPSRNYAPLNTHHNGGPSIIEIPSSEVRGHSPFMHPDRMSTDTFSREELAGAPLRQGVFPRFRGFPIQQSNFVSPGAEMSEMSADEARFRERMRLELQAKDTIPRRLKADDGLKNVFIRLNGEPLENASELRSRIVHGRVIPGRGKIIRSKGPMKIRVSHRGRGKHRIKIIDIFSPKKFNVVDSRSKIIKAPLIKKKTIPRIHGKVKSNLDLDIKPFNMIANTPSKRPLARGNNKQNAGTQITIRPLVSKINMKKLLENQKHILRWSQDHL